mmetsp:Transcript_7787/g.19148  ORF Transcript_7787/g.19148 Transcript_7787/m.19148 type:complete len:203 (-) Transcript_7787:710-1318(-)
MHLVAEPLEPRGELGDVWGDAADGVGVEGLPGKHGDEEGPFGGEALLLGLDHGDALLALPAPCQRLHQLLEVPLLVAAALCQQPPRIGLLHGESVVESDAALGDGFAESGYVAGLLCDGDAVVGQQRVHQLVGQRQVRDGLLVAVKTEVLCVVTGELSADALVLVDHRCDADEPEAVHHELVDEVPQVGQQEARHLPLLVVE